jgi:hypothetical protein
MINWEVKWEVWLRWEKKKDQKNIDELRFEKESEIVMREDDWSNERLWFEMWNGRVYVMSE